MKKNCILGSWDTLHFLIICIVIITIRLILNILGAVDALQIENRVRRLNKANNILLIR